ETPAETWDFTATQPMVLTEMEVDGKVRPVILHSPKNGYLFVLDRETGKPLWESAQEVATMIGKVELSIAAQAERAGHRETPMPFGASILRHRPHGVMAVLGPYNFPGHLPNGHIVPALLAGNTIVFKPSELTPAVGAAMRDAWHAAGLPDDVLQVVQGGRDTGAALVDGRIDGLLFTGSARTGIALNRQFAEMPEKILALEMGGNNPIVVWDTPDLHTAAVLVAQSAFTTAGQRCTAARRLIVQEQLADGLIAELSRLTGRLIVGAPHDDPQPFMGPVIDNETADGLTESFLALLMKGGRPIRHMARPDPARPFVTPGIIDVTDMPGRPDVELFGPLLQ
ncbi:hypothetical protein LTR94_027991, partial [Friedmanniomyces endolithicus]